MKELTLKELQNRSLEILKDVHEFCIANGIKYSLAYGTLLGAVRHKGFIPWDDDVDVFMMRDDYERFAKLYKSEHFKFIDHNTEPSCAINFGRVCDMEKTLAPTTIPWVFNNEPSGVWIDIFPLDYVPEDDDLFQKEGDLIRHINAEQLKLRKGLASMQKGLTLKMNFKAFRKTLKRLRHRPKHTPQAMADLSNNVIEIYSKTGTSMIGQMSLGSAAHTRFRAGIIKNLTEMDFEGCRFLATADYDEVLRCDYGDYMQLPPVDKQKPQQTSYLKFYWRQ